MGLQQVAPGRACWAPCSRSALESHRQKPSWCLVVMTKYFIPAFVAACAQTLRVVQVGVEVLEVLLVLLVGDLLVVA